MRACLCLVAVLLSALPAAAQTRRPLPVIVLDLRGFYTPLGQDPVTATDLFVTAADLPSRGLGAVGGIHVYPFRGQKVSFGIGGEAILAKGRRTADLEEGQADPEPAINQRLQGLSGNISLNFGARDGWSYLTAGMGPLMFGTYKGDEAPPESAPVKMTINYGGGARWFAWRHIAFAVDVRFYQTRPETATLFYPGRSRSSLRIISAGISIR